MRTVVDFKKVQKIKILKKYGSNAKGIYVFAQYLGTGQPFYVAALIYDDIDIQNAIFLSLDRAAANAHAERIAAATGLSLSTMEKDAGPYWS